MGDWTYENDGTDIVNGLPTLSSSFNILKVIITENGEMLSTTPSGLPVGVHWWYYHNNHVDRVHVSQLLSTILWN